MTAISVVIITYNEALNIARCLDAVKDIADEIVVVDSFSTDETAEICKRYTLKFLQHPFKGHVEQKNYALQQTKFPHVLSVDADEVLSEELQNSIKQIKNNWEYDGYYINRLTNYCGRWIKHAGWYPDRKLRLFDKRKGKWAGNNPHDRFEITDKANTKKIRGNLLHYSYPTIDSHLQQTIKFAGISAQVKYKQGKKSGLFKIFFNPGWKFFRQYFLKGGFLDGYYGFVLCCISAFGNYVKYVKLRELYQSKTK